MTLYVLTQAISTPVASVMSASTQATTPPTACRKSGRGGRGGWGGNTKQVAVPGNCYRCDKAGHYVRNCPKRNTHRYPPPDGNVDTSTKVHQKKGDKSDVTMSYCYVCNHWDYYNYPGHDAWQDTQGGDSGTGGHADAAVAAVGGGED